MIGCLEKRFLQADYVNHYEQLESLLFKAVKGAPFQNELTAVCDFYKDDLDILLLETQLQILHTKLSECCDLKVSEIVKRVSQSPEMSTRANATSKNCHKTLVFITSNKRRW